MMTVTLKGMERCGGGNLGGMGDHNLSAFIVFVFVFVFVFVYVFVFVFVYVWERGKGMGDGRRDGRR